MKVTSAPNLRQPTLASRPAATVTSNPNPDKVQIGQPECQAPKKPTFRAPLVAGLVAGVAAAAVGILGGQAGAVTGAVAGSACGLALSFAVVRSHARSMKDDGLLDICGFGLGSILVISSAALMGSAAGIAGLAGHAIGGAGGSAAAALSAVGCGLIAATLTSATQGVVGFFRKSPETNS